MPYSLLIDLVIVIHFLFVFFVIFGGLLVMHKRSWALLHIPAAVWGALVEFTGWICPLTPLENWLRFQGVEPAYTSGFIERYVVSLIYPSLLTRSQQIVLGLGVIMINGVIYGRIIWKKRRQ
ncbi:MAG: DUF2784 domain-containing protein [Syntrophales bacterium]|nr:DUF2784 domain-containing protein [Syntrophales bacterium]